MSTCVSIAILAKAPLIGRAKTRLIPRLGEAGAANLQHWLIRNTVETAIAARVGPVVLWATPDLTHPVFAELATQHALFLRTQPKVDLGERMRIAVAQSPCAATLVIGTDCPHLTPAMLQDGATALSAGVDAVVIPAEDGGYVLIGLSVPHPHVFAGIEWGGAQVLQATRERLQALGWHWREYPTLPDLDWPADYDRLVDTFPHLAAQINTNPLRLR